MEKEINLKYNLPLDSYPLKKMTELFPISNDIIIVVSAIPISDSYAEYMQENTSELCKHFKKDLILGVDIRFEDDDGNEYDDYHEEDDYDEEYQDEQNFDDEQMFDYLRTENLYNDEERQQYSEQFVDNGFVYNFAKIFPEYNGLNVPTYPLYDDSGIDGSGVIYDKSASDELNYAIDHDGHNWMFTFSFRHPISILSDIQEPHIISEATKEYADSISYSLMDVMHNGIINMVHTNSMTLIVNTMRDVAVSHDRIPFVGTVGFNLYLPNLGNDLRYSYMMWTQNLYNMLLEDYVEYESIISPPVVISSDEFYFKPTDFLGQYYMPHGIKIRKEEKKNGRRKECKKNSVRKSAKNNKSKKTSCKENSNEQNP